MVVGRRELEMWIDTALANLRQAPSESSIAVRSKYWNRLSSSLEKSNRSGNAVIQVISHRHHSAADRSSAASLFSEKDTAKNLRHYAETKVRRTWEPIS